MFVRSDANFGTTPEGREVGHDFRIASQCPVAPFKTRQSTPLGAERYNNFLHFIMIPRVRLFTEQREQA